MTDQLVTKGWKLVRCNNKKTILEKPVFPVRFFQKVLETSVQWNLNLTMGQATSKMSLLYRRGLLYQGSYSYLFTVYDWAKENCLLYWRLHYTKVHYIEVPLQYWLSLLNKQTFTVKWKICQCCLFPQAALLLKFQSAGYTSLYVQLVGGKMNSNKFLWKGLNPVGLKSRLSLIIGVNVVLNRTVVVDSDWRFYNLSGSHLQSQSEL